MYPTKSTPNVFELRLSLTLHMHLSMLADTSGAQPYQAIGLIIAELQCVQKLLMSSQGWALQYILLKSIIEEYYKKNYTYIHISMQRATNPSKIHHKNIVLQRACTQNGLYGQKHSKLIDQLAAQVQNQNKQIESLNNQAVEDPTQKEKQLLKKIQACQREQNQLKKEMIRISEMAKVYKQEKLDIQNKNISLIAQLNKIKRDNQQMAIKNKLLNELNTIMTKVTQSSLQIMPQFTSNCEDLYSAISKFEKELHQNSAVGELKKQINRFMTWKMKVEIINRKLILGIAQAQLQGQSISQTISLLKDINLDDLLNIKDQFIHMQQQSTLNWQHFSVAVQSQSQIPHKQLGIHSHFNEFTVIPGPASRMQRILQQICLLFQQQIHLLQTQKMEYQFTKNKKLVTSQKDSCQICQNYQKIVTQIFSIVREGFKEIKFQFLREIKQVTHISEIPFLI